MKYGGGGEGESQWIRGDEGEGKIIRQGGKAHSDEDRRIRIIKKYMRVTAIGAQWGSDSTSIHSHHNGEMRDPNNGKNSLIKTNQRGDNKH